MEKLELTVNGISPLLMHSCVGVNPLHPITKEIKKLTSKRNKTEDDLMAIADLEYKQNLYWDEEVGVYMPAINIEATIREAAKKNRKGKAATSCIFVEPDFIPLKYDGPQTIEGLLLDSRFRDVRVVVVQRARLLRCRPRFDKWGFVCTLNYDPTILDVEEISNALDIAGREIGLCDYRPRYGRFECSIKQL